MQDHQIIHPYVDELRKYCYTVAGTPWDGDDLFQNTVLKVLNKAQSIENHPNPKGYIFKVATNLWRDTLRKSQREVIREAETFEVLSLDVSLLDSIEVLLSYLPFKQASSFLLIEYYGFSMNEIASMLNMTEGGVKAALHRARSNLQKMREESLNRSEPSTAIMERMLKAVQEQNTRTIIATYHLLVSRGVRITKHDTHFSFKIKDPDGNVLILHEKI